MHRARICKGPGAGQELRVSEGLGTLFKFGMEGDGWQAQAMQGPVEKVGAS
jgi:hypothetical protein